MFVLQTSNILQQKRERRRWRRERLWPWWFERGAVQPRADYSALKTVCSPEQHQRSMTGGDGELEEPGRVVDPVRVPVPRGRYGGRLVSGFHAALKSQRMSNVLR